MKLISEQLSGRNRRKQLKFQAAIEFGERYMRPLILLCMIGNLLLLPLFSSAQNQNLDSYFEKRTAQGIEIFKGLG